MRKVQHLPHQGLVMNDTFHEVWEINVSAAQCNKSNAHTAHRWGSISSNGHQFMNVINADIIFKLLLMHVL